MTDKNNIEVVEGSFIRTIPEGLDVEEIMRIEAVYSSSQNFQVEVLPPDNSEVLAKLAETPPFQGGGGTCGGGGASGSW